jgi:hypothetical protein
MASDFERQADRAMAGVAVRGRDRDIPEPKEPNMLRRTEELLGYLSELDQLQAETRRRLYGPSPECDPSVNSKMATEYLDDMLLRACQKAACLVGEQKSILARI